MQVFAIAPAAGRVPWLLLLPIGGIVVAFVALTLLFINMRSAGFELTGDTLRLKGDVVTREILLSDLEGGGVRRVDLTTETGLQTTWRYRGTALAGYRIGWFRLRNGERALVYLTDRTRAVYLPTRLGYSLLVSPDDPDRFLTALRGSR